MTKKNIAIIGSGISGLSAAYFLKPFANVTLYEKEARLGGHTRTLTVDYNGTHIPVDTGFIVFNYENYFHLSRLFETLDVRVKKGSMSFAASVDDGRVEWGAKTLDSLFAQRSNLFNPAFLMGFADVVRFNKLAMETVARLPNLSLGELLTELNMGQWFRNYYLLPMGAAIWSCPAKKMLQFPAASFVRFFHNHGLLTIDNQPQWYTVDGGSQEYVKKIQPIIGDANIKLSSRVRSVVRRDGKVVVQSESGDDVYDDVVLACHADEALGLLVDSDELERDVLSPFKYSVNHAFLHRDTAQMPLRKRCWSSWNYLARSKGQDDSAVAVTYWMNSLQGIDERYPLFVTLNPIKPVDPALIFDKHVFTHPIFTGDAVMAQTHIPRIQGKRQTWFCGAYQGNGFHEDGIKSSVNMVKAMGYSIPWNDQ